MTIATIAGLPVSEWAEADAHIYLWTTNGFMEEAHQIARAWGVKQKTIVTWCKGKEESPRNEETKQIGAGRYFRNSTEHALFCVKGKVMCLRADMPTHFTAPRSRHSEKPAAFYDIVESMSPGPYLDVFARKLRFNWDAWGDEVGTPEGSGLPHPDELRAQSAQAQPAGKEEAPAP
jgi:N6-adenosine-specific RNA methylase IME4